MDMNEALALLERAEKQLARYIDPDREPDEMEVFVELHADIEEALFNRAGRSTSYRSR